MENVNRLVQAFLLVAITALVATGCTLRDDGSRTTGQELRYAPGSMCNPGDRNSLGVCNPNPVPGNTCLVGYQWCNAMTNVATECTIVDVCMIQLPGASDAGLPADAGPDACSPGAQRQCTYYGMAGQPQNVLGFQTCDTMGRYGACQPYGSITMIPGVDAGNPSCGNDPRVTMNQSCTAGIGACMTQGSYVCQNGQVMCSAVPGPVQTEVCDAIDNDCDGTVDEGCLCIAGSTRACYTGPQGTNGVGICHGGSQTCIAGTMWGPCTGEQVPQPETCGSMQDQNCDGMLQLCGPCGGDSRVGAACMSGTSRCAASGTWQCTASDAGAQQLRCSAMTLAPMTETCNGMDEDCDGMVDNNLPANDPGRQCFTHPDGWRASNGKCRPGTRTCTSGTYSGPCMGEILPDPTETCGNAIDDNCDGNVDEGCPTGGDAGVDSGTDAAVDAGASMDAGVDSGSMDAGMDAMVVMDSGTGSDAAVDAGPIVVTPPAGGLRYVNITAQTSSCADMRNITGFEQAGFVTHRVCWQPPAGTNTVTMTQWGDFSNGATLPNEIEIMPYVANARVDMLYQIPATGPSSGTAFNGFRNGDRAANAYGISGGMPTVSGTFINTIVSGGVQTTQTLQHVRNVAAGGVCTGTNAHPIGTPCPPSPTACTDAVISPLICPR